MTIRGRVIVIGKFDSGTSKAGRPWKKQEYVVETDGQYPKKVAFSVMNDKIDQANVQMGQTVEAELDAESREYNGKWYTNLTARKVTNYGFAQQMQQPNTYQQQAPQGYAAPYQPNTAHSSAAPAPVAPTAPIAQSNNNDEMPF